MTVAFTLFIGDNVFTSNGKNIGKISKIDNEHFTVYNRGLIQDEEFQIPISAISHFDIKAGEEDSSIILTVNEEQIKHGYEIVSKKPNSELISGKSNSEYKIPLEKEVIHYETIQHFEEEQRHYGPPNCCILILLYTLFKSIITICLISHMVTIFHKNYLAS